jgi:hypothetical protein
MPAAPSASTSRSDETLTEVVRISRDARVVLLEDYARASPATALTTAQVALLDHVDSAPTVLCRAAQGVLVLPEIAVAAGVPTERTDERNIRLATDIVALAMARDVAPLGDARPITARVLGSCRHFAVLSCAFLRARAVPARARCGFETYFRPGRHNDHWITEYWDGTRWVRIDSEILGFDLVERPDDLADGQFLTGAEGWAAYRAGADPLTFGVHGTDNWGPAEIVGNVIRDLAAVNKVETLPWDEWGPMRSCYDHGVTDEIELLMDEITAALIADDAASTTALCALLRVPSELSGEMSNFNR